jgi:hypothetical protein
MLHNLYIIQKLKPILLKRYSIFFVLILCIILFSCGLQKDNPADASSMNSSENTPHAEKAQIVAEQADVSSVDEIVGALYALISFPKGGKPDMDRLRSLFTPEAVFIRSRQDGLDRMDLESFTTSFQERIANGALESFFETEIFRKTNVYGNIAHVFSSYKKRMNTENPDVYTRGINSIQLYSDGQRWWVCSIIWEDERSDNPIPKEYLRVRN